MDLARLLLLLVVLSHPSNPMILLNPIYRSKVSAFPRPAKKIVTNLAFWLNHLNRRFCAHRFLWPCWSRPDSDSTQGHRKRCAQKRRVDPSLPWHLENALEKIWGSQNRWPEKEHAPCRGLGSQVTRKHQVAATCRSHGLCCPLLHRRQEHSLRFTRIHSNAIFHGKIPFYVGTVKAR